MLNLDIIQDEADKAPWEFTYAGRSWKLPHVSDLTLDEQTALADGRAIKSVLAKRAVEVTDEGDKPNGVELGKLWGARKGSTNGAYLALWLAHAGVEPGESPASSR